MKREMRKTRIPQVVAPSIFLINPKFPHNVGAAVRAASCFGASQVWFTGNRVPLDPENGYRLPREERMKGYQKVDLINYDYPFDQILPGKGITPVAIEVRRNSENLITFEHPDNPVYVMGPEDGSIPKVFLRHCHRFVVIPTAHCLNLAAAVNVVLYDFRLKRYLTGKEELKAPGEYLDETRGMIGDC